MAAKYSQLTDIIDPALTPRFDEKYLLKADTFVDAALVERSIPLADIVLPQSLLTELAVNIACRLACIDKAMTDNSPMIAKAREYERTINMLLAGLNLEAVGITVQASADSYGSFSLGRA